MTEVEARGGAGTMRWRRARGGLGGVALVLGALFLPEPVSAQDPSELFRDARYAEAIERTTELLAQGDLTPAQKATAEVVRAASWLEEGRLARRTAGLEAEVLAAWYRRLLDSGVGTGDDTLVGFHLALAELRDGHHEGALERLASIAESGHPVAPRARSWRAVAGAMASGNALPGNGGNGSAEELALARLARGTMPTAVPPPSVSSRPRAYALAALLTWAAGPAPRGPLDPAVLGEPMGSAGRADDRDVPLRDPWLLQAYATVCLDEAHHALAGLDPPAGRLRAYAETVRGKVLLLAGRYDEAARAFDGAGGEAATALAGLARARAAGSPVVPAIVSASRSGSPRATAEVVLAAAFESLDVTGATADVAGALASWEDAFSVESADFSLGELRWGRWAAARLWWQSGDLERATRGMSQAYDPGRVGDHRANPPAWLPDWIAVMMRDVNNQTLVLRTTWEAAQANPMYRGVYDGLQGYFVFTNVDPQKGVR